MATICLDLQVLLVLLLCLISASLVLADVIAIDLVIEFNMKIIEYSSLLAYLVISQMFG